MNKLELIYKKKTNLITKLKTKNIKESDFEDYLKQECGLAEKEQFANKNIK